MNWIQKGATDDLEVILTDVHVDPSANVNEDAKNAVVVVDEDECGYEDEKCVNASEYDVNAGVRNEGMYARIGDGDDEEGPEGIGSSKGE